MAFATLFKSVLVASIYCTAFFSAVAESIEIIESPNPEITINEPTTTDLTIEERFVPVTLTRVGQEDSEYAVNSTNAGFGRMTTVGISVSKGTSAKMYYDIEVHAVSADVLAKKDAQFAALLSKKEKKFYDRLSSKYDGGLDIPFLKWLGINLDFKTTKERMDYAAERQEEYAARSFVAESIMKDFVTQKIRVSGSLKAKGTSSIPQTAFAFIKLAVVKFQDGSNLNVVSSHKDDLVAASADGKTTFPTSNEDLNIFPL